MTARMSDLTGWLLEVYDDPGGGVVLWLLGDDGVRHRLHQDFPVTFYAAGPAAHLRQLWRYLQEGKVPVRLSRTERRDLFQPEPVTVLSIEVEHPADQPPLFQQLARLFPELTYYDADLPLALRFAALHGTFPLARCRMCADEEAASGSCLCSIPPGTWTRRSLRRCVCSVSSRTRTPSMPSRPASS